MQNIAAIITIYSPTENLPRLVENISSQVAHVIVVDNGQNTSLQQKLPHCHWIDNPDNGLAKAQNMGVEAAKTLGADAILLLDDDSEPAPDMVPNLVSAWQAGMGIIAPVLVEANGHTPPFIQPRLHVGWKRRQALGTDPLRNLFYVAASGSLIPMDVLDHAGPFKESFFIYFIDTEFCLRLRQLGYDICVIPSARMTHHFGHISHATILGKTLRTTNHSPTARYWMWRNRTSLWYRYAIRETGYVLFDMVRSVTELVRVALWEKQRAPKLCAMMRGLFRLPLQPTTK